MPQRNVATNFTFEQQRAEINLLAQDFWSQKTTVDGAASTYLKHDGSNAYTGGTLAVPNAFTINANSGAGTLTISGNLQVTGTTTTVNTATLDVTDKNITIAKGVANDAAADGAGVTIDSSPHITWNFVDAKDAWVSSIGVEASTTLAAGGLASLQGARFAGTQTPTAGVGVEITQPDANTGNIQTYDRTNSSYKDLRIKGTGVDFYAGSTNVLSGGFHNAGLIMASGKKIGVNTTSPNAPIEIIDTGTAQIRAGYSAAKYVQIGRSSGGTYQFISQEQGAKLEFGTSDASDGAGAVAMTIDRYGKVGIGDTAPGAALTVTGGGGAGAFIYSAGATNGGVLDLRNTTTSNYTWRLAVGGGDNSYVQGRGFFIRDENSSATRFAISDSGRIAINKTNPQRTLDIVTLTNENGFCLDTIGTAANYQFDIRDDGEVQLRVDSTGNVGIGEATTDGNKLIIRAASTVATKNGHIMLTGDGADVGEGPQIVFSEAGGGDNWAGGYVGFKRTGGGSVGDLVFGTRGSTGDANTVPTQRLLMDSTGNINVTGSSTGNSMSEFGSNTGGLTIDDVGVGNTALRISHGADDTYLVQSSNGNFYMSAYTDNDMIFGCGTSGNERLRIYGSNGNAVFTGTVSDASGNLRFLPRNEPGTAYTAVAADGGKFISTNADVTFNGGIWSTGQAITIYNYGGSPINIVSGGSSFLMHWTDGTTATTGTRILASRGVCTLLCVQGPNTFVISGAVT